MASEKDREYAEREEERMRKLLGDNSGGNTKGKPITIVQPKLHHGSAEQALLAGETEEEMIARKTKELKLKARQKEKREREPDWKKKQREREDRERRENEDREQKAREAYAKRAVENNDWEEKMKKDTEERERREKEEKDRLWKAKKEAQERESSVGKIKDDDTADDSWMLQSDSGRKEEARLRGHWLSTTDPSSPLKSEGTQQTNNTPTKVNIPSQPISWDLDRVCQWLTTLELDASKLNDCQRAFRSNDINGKSLLSLTKEELDEIGINSLGIKKVILEGIDKLKAT